MNGQFNIPYDIHGLLMKAMNVLVFVTQVHECTTVMQLYRFAMKLS